MKYEVINRAYLTIIPPLFEVSPRDSFSSLVPFVSLTLSHNTFAETQNNN